MTSSWCVLYCLLLSSLVTSALKSLGFDFGTSGVRVIGISKDERVLHEESVRWSDNIFKGKDMEDSWLHGLYHLLGNVPTEQRRSLERICLSGTSASALIYDINKKCVSRKTRMYNYNIAQNGHSPEVVEKVNAAIKSYCPPSSPAAASTSSLAKLLCWHFEENLSKDERLCHQVLNNSCLHSISNFLK